MDYFNILNFKKEPFSNSPEPEFLLQLPQYSDCLQKLELAVRLRRGINVVVGDIGTGKTTLCRKLIQNLSSPSQDAEASEIE
ncbi:MAG TPA: general secretion pathway protein, partial [Alphaproteobacteria bacterium]|nr:general secretion pathway protein [Alphaproteobacteria bacterium]